MNIEIEKIPVEQALCEGCCFWSTRLEDCDFIRDRRRCSEFNCVDENGQNYIFKIKKD